MQEKEVDINHISNETLWVRFLYIVCFITFSVTAVCFSGIIHYAIGQRFGDSTTPYKLVFDAGLLTAYLSALIVSFPMFAVSFLRIHRLMVSYPQTKKAPERKQVGYVILLFSFVILFIHLIIFVFSVINGQMTAEGLTHFVADIVIVGSIFSFALIEVKDLPSHA